MTNRLAKQIQFLREIDGLKTVLRMTSVADRSRRENSAEHSWHIATMAVTLAEHAPDDVHIDRVVRMLLIHDIVEVDAGDTFAFDVAANHDKADRERAAADRLFGLLPVETGTAFRALWEEFEAGQTPEGPVLAFTDLKQYSVFQVAKDRGVSIVLVAAILILLGLLPALYSSRRKVWVRVEPSEGGSRLLVGGFALQRKAQFEEEFERLVETLVRAAGGAGTDDAEREKVGTR